MGLNKHFDYAGNFSEIHQPYGKLNMFHPANL